jgi:hypothetical protein
MSIKGLAVYNAIKANNLEAAAAELQKSKLTGREIELMAQATNNPAALTLLLGDSRIKANHLAKAREHAKKFNNAHLSSAVAAHSLASTLPKEEVHFSHVKASAKPAATTVPTPAPKKAQHVMPVPKPPVAPPAAPAPAVKRPSFVKTSTIQKVPAKKTAIRHR